MNHIFDFVQNVDLGIYHALGCVAGNWFIDRFVEFQESNQIFKGGFIFAMYWWVWFRHGPDREKHRNMILAIISATLLAVVVTRILAVVTPFRLRPIYIPALRHTPVPSDTALAQWNSFPSDTAAYLCALTFGLIVLLPRYKAPIILYTAGWICLPRIYLGYHYASDVVAGAVIGVGAVWAVLRSKWLQTSVMPRIAGFADSTPGVFYAAAFLITFEMATIFWDVRMLERNLVHVVRALEHKARGAPTSASPTDSLLVFTLLLLAVAGGIAILLIRQRARARVQIMTQRKTG
jgi:membrane-associated phospholipid phosphatase